MWSRKQTETFIKELEDNAWTPDAELRGAKKVTIDSRQSLLDLPKSNAAYWVSTNEPVLHSMHKHTNPMLLENGHEVIYNGVTMGLRSRITEHLLRKKCKGNSGISVDIFCDDIPPSSHIKKAMAPGRKKTCFVNTDLGLTRVQSNKKLLSRMNLTSKEAAFVDSNKTDTIYFWNGINVCWDKHKEYEWVVHYVETASNPEYTGIIEHLWRERYGYPRLISYLKGR